MPIDGGPIERLSAFATGVAGITTSSPALSASPTTGRLAFSVFQDDGHAIYVLDTAQIVSLVPPDPSDNAAVLPGRTAATGDVAAAARGHVDADCRSPRRCRRRRRTSRRLSLDEIGQPTVTAGVSQFGTFVGGSMSAIFSDMLGDRALGASGHRRRHDRGLRRAADLTSTASIAGTGPRGRRRRRFVSGYLTVPVTDPATVEIDDGAAAPDQPRRRRAGGVSVEFDDARRVQRRVESRVLLDGDPHAAVRSRERVPALADRQHRARGESAVSRRSASAALVHDSAFFGATSPIYGGRFRIEADQSRRLAAVHDLARRLGGATSCRRVRSRSRCGPPPTAATAPTRRIRTCHRRTSAIRSSCTATASGRSRRRSARR